MRNEYHPTDYRSWLFKPRQCIECDSPAFGAGMRCGPHNLAAQQATNRRSNERHKQRAAQRTPAGGGVVGEGT
jgi:hypothetical protein